MTGATSAQAKGTGLAYRQWFAFLVSFAGRVNSVRGAHSSPEQRRSNLLAWLLIALLFLSCATFALMLSLFHRSDAVMQGKYVCLIGGVVCLLAVAFSLNRADHYSGAAAITIGTGVLGPWGSFLIDPLFRHGDFMPLVYCVIPVLLCGLLLSALPTAVLTAMQIGALALLHRFNPAVHALNWPSLSLFVVFTSTISVVSTLISRQDLAQIERQAAALASDIAVRKEAEMALRRAQRELEWLQEISQHLNGATTLDEVLDIAYDGLRVGLGYDRVGIDLIDYDAGVYREARGTDDQGHSTSPVDRTTPLGADSLIWRLPGISNLLRGDRLYFSENIFRECPEDLRYLLDGPATENLMAPLRAGEHIIGTISVDNLLSGRPIDPAAAGPLLAMCNHVATALERARLYERERAERAALEVLATTDMLTHLPNRGRLLRQLAQGVAEAGLTATTLGILLLDLDRFKEVNDHLGHLAGDALLVAVADRLRSTVRAADTVARLGGDEFVIVVVGADITGAETVARQVLTAFETPFLVDDQALGLGVSIGIAVYPRHGAEASALLQHADAAMYAAKRARLGSTTYHTSLDGLGCVRQTPADAGAAPARPV